MHIEQRAPARAAASREWLLANGLGGSASGTVSGARTRPSHGYLIAADPSGSVRTALLSIQDRVLWEHESFELSWSDADMEFGLPHRGVLETFRLDPWPTWRYRTGPLVLEKYLFLIYEHNAVVITYRHLEGRAGRLTAAPILPEHDPTVAPGARERHVVHTSPGRVRIQSDPEQAALFLWHNGVFVPAPSSRDQARDMAASEAPARDVSQGRVEATLGPDATIHILASTEEDLLRALAKEDRLGDSPPRSLSACVATLEQGERECLAAWERAALAGAAITSHQAHELHPSPDTVRPQHSWTAFLARSLQLGLARRGERLTLLSSLPGAIERGEETLRALAGLVAFRAFEAVREILLGTIEHLSDGLAPETFDSETGTPRYGAAAPALWLVIVAELFARRSQERDCIAHPIYPALETIMGAYREGTKSGIRVGADGLLSTGGMERTPAVLNALWSRALIAMAQLGRSMGRKESAAFYLAWAREHQSRFKELLWDETGGCLYRALGPHGRYRV
jgi:hypothetical protein